MTDLAARFADGSVLLWIVALVFLEALVLTLLWRLRGRGFAPHELWGQLVSGAALMLAVRAALLGHDWRSIAVWLLIAGVAHVLDLGLRYRAQSASSIRRT